MSDITIGGPSTQFFQEEAEREACKKREENEVSEELKPCQYIECEDPTCVRIEHHVAGVQVVCDSCGASGPIIEGIPDAIIAWNRRAPSEPPCSVCAGSGKPLSGAPCICDGIGTQAAELHGLRQALYAAERAPSEALKVVEELQTRISRLFAANGGVSLARYRIDKCECGGADIIAGVEDELAIIEARLKGESNA